MSDQWMIRGVSYGNCNCAWGCPCQFGSPTTNGNCEAILCGHIEEGHFNDTRLDGLNWALLVHWPGEIADGDGTQQVIIDERADDEQRVALETIIHGESTAPGATHFYIYSTTMSTVLDTLYAPIELSIDVDARTADVKIDGLATSSGRPIISKFSGEPVRAGIHLPGGFEYTYAEMGNGNSKVDAGIELDLTDSYGQFNILHLTQDGVVRN